MGRKELLALVGEIARMVFFDAKEMSNEEKIVRIKSLLIDALSENSESPVPKFGQES